MNITIRPCMVNEIDTLQEIAYETFNEAFRSMNRPEIMDQYLKEAFDKKKLSEELHNEGSWFYFLCFNDQLAGYLKINKASAQSDINDEDSLEIERIYIRKEYKGKGFGRLFVEFAFQQAAEMKKNYIWLGVWEKNIDAIAFYKKLGFQESGRHLFRMSDELQSDLIMKRIMQTNPLQ
jgi:ribosomal protein S18 acetylase RimI-like enzyme